MQSEQHADEVAKLGIRRLVTVTPSGLKELNADACDVVEAHGVKVSTALFEFFADDANKGHAFRFVKREADGAVTVARLTESFAGPS